MSPTIPTDAVDQSVTLTGIVSAVHMLPALDKLRLIRILAEELEAAREILPFEAGKTYYLPTPYNSPGAAEILAEAMAAYQEESD